MTATGPDQVGEMSNDTEILDLANNRYRGMRLGIDLRSLRQLFLFAAYEVESPNMETARSI